MRTLTDIPVYKEKEKQAHFVWHCIKKNSFRYSTHPAHKAQAERRKKGSADSNHYHILCIHTYEKKIFHEREAQKWGTSELK